MTFDPYLKINIYAGEKYVQGDSRKYCVVCDALTVWVSVTFQAHVCSPHCGFELKQRYERDKQKR